MFNSNILRNFNSIKVRLKPNFRVIAAGNTKFQFHKGTIKTVKSKNVCNT